MKIVLILLCSLFAFSNIQAQKVKIKKDVIYLDDKQIMTREVRQFRSEHYFFDPQGKEVINFILKKTTSTEATEEAYVYIYFPTTKQSLEVPNVRTIKATIKWFLENKVIDTNGYLQEEAIEQFVQKYDTDFPAGN